MSYSRWDVSRWYTYWSCNSDDTRDKQVFQICGTAWFYYEDLKEDIERCLALAMVREECTDMTDRDELKIYMQRFMGDVERSYPDNGLTKASKKASEDR